MSRGIGGADVKEVTPLVDEKENLSTSDQGIDATEASRSECDRFEDMASDGELLFAVVYNSMAFGLTCCALKMICQDNNWQKISCALARTFHTNDYMPLSAKKARGRDRLRDLVTTCVTNLRDEGHGLPPGYDRLVQQLFTSEGRMAP